VGEREKLARDQPSIHRVIGVAGAESSTPQLVLAPGLGHSAPATQKGHSPVNQRLTGHEELKWAKVSSFAPRKAKKILHHHLANHLRHRFFAP
jgi:hypothetical protein